jgi:hypothetical protein
MLKRRIARYAAFAYPSCTALAHAALSLCHLQHGWTALMAAASRGHYAVVEYLLAHARANALAVDFHQADALSYATQFRHESVVRLLKRSMVAPDCSCRECAFDSPSHGGAHHPRRGLQKRDSSSSSCGCGAAAAGSGSAMRRDADECVVS